MNILLITRVKLLFLPLPQFGLCNIDWIKNPDHMTFGAVPETSPLALTVIPEPVLSASKMHSRRQ